MASLPLYLNVDATRSEPLQTQVYRGIRRAIVDGRVAPGSFLPSTRVLAADLKVGRNTVIRAIQRLRVEGLVESLVGAGVRVRERVSMEAPVALTHDELQAGAPSLHKLSARGEALLDLPNAAPGRGTPSRPFQTGLPPLDIFPARVWARLASRRWRTTARAMIEPCDPLGYRPLRVLIADYLRTARGIECTADHIVITSGAQHSMDIIVRALLNAGDRVWVEDPTRPDTHRALAAIGACPIPVAVDREGFNAPLARRLGAVRMAIVTPSCHFPTGVTLTLRRRLELVAWAHEANGWIVEDDHCAETRFVGRPLPAIHRLDGGRRTLYVGSFANAVFPGLCLGYVVAPDAIRDEFLAARAVGDQHAPSGIQAVLSDFIDQGHFAAYLGRLRGALSERYDALMCALATHCGTVLDPWPANAGMHIVAWLPSGTTERAIVREAARVGVEVRGLGRLRQVPGSPGLVLCFGGWGVETIIDAARRLGSAIDPGISELPAAVEVRKAMSG